MYNIVLEEAKNKMDMLKVKALKRNLILNILELYQNNVHLRESLKLYNKSKVGLTCADYSMIHRDKYREETLERLIPKKKYELVVALHNHLYMNRRLTEITRKILMKEKQC